MFEELEVMRMANGLASRASARQSVIARNVAHADTPGYKTHDVASFSETYRQQAEPFAMRATRAGHLYASPPGTLAAPVRVSGGDESPNGNDVSLEQEMVKAANARQKHDMALSIYDSVRGILRTSLGRGR